MRLHNGSRARQTRALIAEGFTLLTYLVGRKPTGGMVKRYVCGVLASGDARPLELSGLMHRWPRLVRSIDPVRNGCLMRNRLYLASLVAEASPRSARIYYDYEGQSTFLVATRLLGLACLEGMLLLPRLLAGTKRRQA